MHRKIEPRRHFTLFDLFRDIFGVLLRVVPLGEIQMAASAVDVSLEKPRYRRDVRIPGPNGLIAVTVEAGPVDQFLRLR